jgi:hypothetical protein
MVKAGLTSMFLRSITHNGSREEKSLAENWVTGSALLEKMSVFIKLLD